MVENFANIFIDVSNTSQLKENALLGNAIVNKIHDNRFWFRQNVLFNDTAYVFEGILRVEGNKDHMIVTSILYPITTNPNTEEFFDSFQFHTTPTKSGISTKSSQ
ncbi:hypothetical protein H6769_05745 [Candidatus Peribacteria bacterium]|nr:hypothetical protein [Candidatus Peribacteria bacterium]